MKRLYSIQISKRLRAVLALARHSDGWMIMRLNVPKQYRGKGYGRKLLQEVLDDSDKMGFKLYLAISAGDGLTFAELEQWYMRRGFIVYNALVYVRHPQIKELL